jgi:outer membrane protein OmpA-like peptidoglycan-associated protein
VSSTEITASSSSPAAKAGDQVDETAASIFISYAHRDREHADRLSARLSAAGYSVWWDRQIRTGDHFDQVIEAAHEAAKLVIVLWSAHSVSSNWVRAEASRALDDDKLLPVRIDSARLPLRFTQVQTVGLAGWDGRTDTEELIALLREVGTRLGSSGGASPVGGTGEPQTLQRPRRRLRFAITFRLAVTLSVVAIAGILGAGWYLRLAWREAPPPIAAVAPAKPTSVPATSEPTAPAQPTSQVAVAVSPQIGAPIIFDRGSAAFTATAQSAIKTQLAALKANPGLSVMIEGYAQSGEGPRDTLQALAELRARRVQRELTEGGVDPARLTIAAHEDAAPAGDGQGGLPRVILNRR